MGDPVPTDSHQSWQRGDYCISTDPARFDFEVIYDYLSASYWSAGIPRVTVHRGIRNSLCFGVLHHDPKSRSEAQVGFARIISDRASFAYLADVFILEPHRGKGLSKWLMECIISHPELQGLRRWMLATRDAQGLYAKFGFTPLHAPERFMQRWDPDVYKRQPQSRLAETGE